MGSDMLNAAISRRLALAALGAGGLALAMRDSASGQVATPAPELGGDHPIVGAWLCEIDLEPGPPWVTTFSSNGVYITYDPNPRVGLGIGYWLALGPRSVMVASNIQQLRGEPSLEKFREMLNAQYVPQPHAFDSNVLGFRETFEIRAVNENRFLATGVMEVRNGTAPTGTRHGSFRRSL